MKFNFLYIVLFLFLTGISCKEKENFTVVSQVPNLNEWLVPKEEVIDAGPGKDGIPSIDHPQFSASEEIGPYFDHELVLGIEHEGEIKAYPMPILNWHEIVNDEINGLPIAITYCPLTGTGIGWGRQLRSKVNTFGVSGLLYNTNLMPYDRNTNSTWSQQRMECVNGLLQGFIPPRYTLIETTFATWKKSFPNSIVMNGNTGFSRKYSIYPYGDYRNDDELLLFPVSHKDDRIPAKERVLGVSVAKKWKAYRFNSTDKGIEVIHDEIEGSEIIVVRSKKDNINTVFLNPDGVQFETVQHGFPAIITDESGNSYDLAGRTIAGPDQGQKLGQPLAFMGFWFSWAAFYPEIEIYE